MMRFAPSTLVIGSLFLGASLVACGDDGGTAGGVDAQTGNLGFATPTETTKAWKEEAGVWVEQGDADWSCLNTPNADTASTVAINLTGDVEDFQTGDEVPGADIEAFNVVDFTNVIATATSDVDGAYALTLPVGGKRIGYKVTAEGTLPTYILNHYYDPATVDQRDDLNSVSELTANALPAFIGVTRTPGLGILAGAIRDCQDREVSGAIATISATSGTPTHLDGAQSYYFSAGSTSLPVRHGQAQATNKDGLFVVIELPVASTAYMQVWGFLPSQNPATDELTLLAETPSPVLADAVITAAIEPLRSN